MKNNDTVLPSVHRDLRYSRLLYGLLFLFPLAGNTVTSWTGVIFAFIFLTSLLAWKSFKFDLTKSEKFLLSIALSIFFVTVASNLSNGWEYAQTRGLGVYARWVLFVPVYLYIRKHNESFFWLANGSALAGFILLIQGLFDLLYYDLDRAYGVYESPGLIGIQSIVFAITIIGALKRYRPSKIARLFYFLGLASAICVFFISGSRSSYVLLVILVPIICFLFLRLKKGLSLILLSVIPLGSLYLSSDFVSNRVNSGLTEINAYWNDVTPAKSQLASVGQRIEMWKVSLMIHQDNPVLGVGWRNFQSNAKLFADSGRVSALAAQSPHPHSTYLEFLVTTGAVGLFCLIALLAHGVQVGRNLAKTKPLEGNILLVFILVFIVNGVNEGGSFIYGNALSFFLIYLAVFFSSAQPDLESTSPRSANH